MYTTKLHFIFICHTCECDCVLINLWVYVFATWRWNVEAWTVTFTWYNKANMSDTHIYILGSKHCNIWHMTYDILQHMTVWVILLVTHGGVYVTMSHNLYIPNLTDELRSCGYPSIHRWPDAWEETPIAGRIKVESHCWNYTKTGTKKS